MKIHIMRWSRILLALVIYLGVCGCAAGGKEPTAAQKRAQDDLGQEFMSDLSGKILPNKDNMEYLRSLGVMLSESESVKDMSAFDAFMQTWESGEDGVLTVAFRAGNDVYARYQRKDGMGYYFRYEVPAKENNGEFSVVGKVFEDIELVFDEQLGKLQFRLIYNEQSIATFTFRPVWYAGEEGEPSGADIAV